MIRNAKHIGFIQSLPCALQSNACGGDICAAHIRIGGWGGKGLKPHDSHTVPLCHAHHSEQHRIGERSFWKCVQKAINLAAYIYANTGNREACMLKIAEFRREFYNQK